MDIKKTVGKRIQKYRKLNKLTQEKLAEMINLETISLSRIETGKNYPTSENLAKISEILSVEPYEFFLPETNKTNSELIKDIYKQIELAKSDNKKLAKIKNIIDNILY